MTYIGMHEAKTNLSQLVERSLGGEEIVLTRRGVPAVKLEPVQRKRTFQELRGIWADRPPMDWEAWDALDEEIADQFNNSKIWPDE